MVLLAALGLPACRGGGTTPPDARPILPAAGGDAATLAGSGSTFVEPLLRAWTERYKGVAPGVTINYEATGSGAAVDGLKEGGADFFASDVPLSEIDEATLGGSDEVVQVPWAAGAIALAYNLPDVGALRLSPEVLAAIFGGRIVRWDDAAIQADNPGVRLPSLGIQVVFRSDSSGSTYVFTSFLAEAAGWERGLDFSVRFPRGQGVRGSEAVAAAVERTAGSIGYVSAAHARQAGVSIALLGNRAGRFVAPTPEAVGAALAGAQVRAYGTTARLALTPDAPGAYPLATLSYLMFPRKMADPAKAIALRHFGAWAMSEGQRLAEPLGYTQLPHAFQVRGMTAIEQD